MINCLKNLLIQFTSPVTVKGILILMKASANPELQYQLDDDAYLNDEPGGQGNSDADNSIKILGDNFGSTVQSSKIISITIWLQKREGQLKPNYKRQFHQDWNIQQFRYTNWNI